VPIQSISKAAPCVITTSQNHVLPAGWRFKSVGAGGMKEINNVGDSYHIATSVTNNTITINQVNSLLYTTYTSGGVVEYNEPVDLSTYSARLQIRQSVESSSFIYEATSAGGQIVLDNSLKTISLTILGNVTSQFTFTTAVYSMELFNGNNVIPFIVGNLTLVPEVTR
jgi:hypothetical protein